MDAFILHADGDEGYAQDIARRIAPTSSINAKLASGSALSFGEQLMVVAVWSAGAEAAGLGRQLADLARSLGDRCIVIRADGTPLPALAGTAQIAVLGRDNDLLAMLKVARLRTRPAAAPTSVRSSFQVSSVGPGVGVGLAIYAGMFVAAGAWRSDEISQAIATDKEAPAVLALRSFQTAFDAPETAHVTVAAAAPNARFVQPHRVIVTASMDSRALPVVAAETHDAPTPLARVDHDAKPPSTAVTSVPLVAVPDIAGAGAATLSLISLDGMATFEAIQNEAF
ncbi:MAG: hypothetical protein IV086_15520 [Hyphomonadaceae bacterium]|nr:MAG: hypothetical protein FD160_3369 [Caulobacteraceae bacterium]MBT9447110.1 hypothetical protein [Hyphomonadaceae bacterium]TPW05809.1 MAG: hypothetical protein FD124_2014 [Alphaproteobacteria bacterium]